MPLPDNQNKMRDIVSLYGYMGKISGIDVYEKYPAMLWISNQYIRQKSIVF